ncbi:hypothetical protein DFH07DRAFT_863774 [Mycena maculata]|uniref:F-box domain-containing protein n=1 Tax=Mycena maculata TaxID=230809 RepID=A0AAD7MEX5_9AGAR|nr:hypothetical protein DFH07DRAFT_863774 [Mycena maculata]
MVFMRPRISSDFEAITLCPPGDYIFPNLKKLRWSPKPGVSFHHTRLFLSPRLSDLIIGSIDAVADLCVLTNLAAKCPSLTKVAIHIHTQSLRSLAIPGISAAVSRLTRFQFINVPGLDEAALAHVAHLPDLRSLELRSQAPSTFTSPTTDKSAAFPGLTHLELPTMENATSLLTTVGKCSLVELTIPVPGDLLKAAIAGRFYSALAKHCSHSSLRKLSVVGPRRVPVAALAAIPPDELHIYTVRGDILNPLYSFANLESVWLSDPTGFDLDNGTVMAMARARPHIASLSLGAGATEHGPSRVTLEALYAFAKWCPRLRRLEMTLNAIVVPKVRINGKKRASQRTLRTLNVAGSAITKPQRVAKFPSAIFPELESIGTLYEELEEQWANEDEDEEEVVIEGDLFDYNELWKEAEDALFSFEIWYAHL